MFFSLYPRSFATFNNLAVFNIALLFVCFCSPGVVVALEGGDVDGCGG